MNIKILAEEWLTEHKNKNACNASFKVALESLIELLLKVHEYDGTFSYDEVKYDENFGDDRECKCGHSYYRHFDPYEQMSPVWCKYCKKYTMADIDNHIFDEYCPGFEERVKKKPAAIKKNKK